MGNQGGIDLWSVFSLDNLHGPFFKIGTAEILRYFAYFSLVFIYDLVPLFFVLGILESD